MEVIVAGEDAVLFEARCPIGPEHWFVGSMEEWFDHIREHGVELQAQMVRDYLGQQRVTMEMPHV